MLNRSPQKSEWLQRSNPSSPKSAVGFRNFELKISSTKPLFSIIPALVSAGISSVYSHTTNPEIIPAIAPFLLPPFQ